MAVVGMKQVEVNVEELLFTQDSVKVTFRKPRQDQRIDDTVGLIIQGKIKTTDFPRLQVVWHEGHFWSLDNRRLWIFKKAKISRVTVDLVPYHHHPRFAEAMANPELKETLQQTRYLPRVRGKCQKKFVVPRGARPLPDPRSPLVASPRLAPSPVLKTSPLLPQHSNIRSGTYIIAASQALPEKMQIPSAGLDAKGTPVKERKEREGSYSRPPPPSTFQYAQKPASAQKPATPKLPIRKDAVVIDIPRSQIDDRTGDSSHFSIRAFCSQILSKFSALNLFEIHQKQGNPA